MEEKQMVEEIQLALDESEWGEDDGITTKTFEEVGMLTANAGFVITMSDGFEFQITVVKLK